MRSTSNIGDFMQMFGSLEREGSRGKEGKESNGYPFPLFGCFKNEHSLTTYQFVSILL
jgi:hypothetical protein